MSFFSMLKQNAKRALRDNWGSAIAVQLAPFLMGLFTAFLSLFFNFNTGLSNLGFVMYSDGTMQFDETMFSFSALVPYLIGYLVLVIFGIFISQPLLMGVTYWHNQLASGRPETAGSIFHFFESGKRYSRAIGFSFQMTVRQLGWAFLFLLLPFSVYFFGLELIILLGTPSDGLYAAVIMGSIVFLLLYIGLAILYIAYMNKYFLAAYRLCEDDETPIHQLIRSSIQDTKGYRFSLLGFRLSFIGWTFLSTLLAPLQFYTGPYINASTAMYARYIMETTRRERPEILSTDPSDPQNPPLPPQGWDGRNY